MDKLISAINQFYEDYYTQIYKIFHTKDRQR